MEGRRPAGYVVASGDSRAFDDSGIFVDYDVQDRIVGIEMLYLSKRAPETDLRRLLFESVPEVA